MISESDYYHGAVLRKIIGSSDYPLTIAKCDNHGRLNSYSINGRMAIYIKHSTKRLTPWSFSFTVDHLRELAQLRASFESVWLILVCGSDGVVCLTLNEFVSISGARPGGVASLRVDRLRRSMYRVYGNESKLPVAKPNGLTSILELFLTYYTGETAGA